MKLLLPFFFLIALSSQRISVSDKPLSDMAEYEIAGRYKNCTIDLETAAKEAVELYSGYLAKKAIEFRKTHPCLKVMKSSTTLADGYFQFKDNFISVKPQLKERATKFYNDFLACKIEGAAALKELLAIVKEDYVIWFKVFAADRKC